MQIDCTLKISRLLVSHGEIAECDAFGPWGLEFAVNGEALLNEFNPPSKFPQLYHPLPLVQDCRCLRLGIVEFLGETQGLLAQLNALPLLTHERQGETAIE